MMNFLDPLLSPKVICDKSAMDGYEAQNLLSKNFLQKSNGFLAYSTVKPPVELDFEFIASVDIHYIQIKATVGNHRISGLEIFAKCDEHYVSIGKSLFDEDGVVFLSSRQYSKNKLPSSVPKNYHVCFLRRVGKVIHNATKVKFRIIRSGKYVPCLGSVEIWGKVSRNCTEETKNTVQKLYENSQMNSLHFATSSVPIESCSTSSDCKDGIPEDFKDDLTYELMTMPMTLPSGKTIDQSTLDKHIASEKTFGRKPGDPFTGIKFTNTMKPLLNVALKCRIDMFMLQNSSKPEFFSVARIVGRKEKNVIESNCDNDVKRIKLDDGDEITIDTSRFKFKRFGEKVPNCCYICKNVEMLFSLPCKHLYCRNCLNEICKESKCKYCSESFARSNVRRFHI